MKIAYMILHYGLPYLGASLKAIKPQVDHIVILYSATPSQGFSTNLECPDTREELKEVADKYGCEWVDGNWSNEGEHNDAIWPHTQGYDWIVRFDSDEIFPPGSVDYFIETAKKTNAKIFKAPFIHFWRSFSKVCRDGQMPDRLIRVNGGEGYSYLDDGTLIGKPNKYRVYHMGYVQPNKYIEYKMQVQAHHNEWRPDWYQEKWLKNDQIDVHPVVFNFWNTEEFNKNLMPQVLREHQYFDLEIVK